MTPVLRPGDPAGPNLAQLLLPYSAGPIDAFHTPGAVDALSAFWGSVGGYLDATLLAAALVGAVGRRNRILRLVLVAWVAVCLARTYGFSPVVQVLAHVPGLRLTAFYRYADPTWELAVVVLAALGLDDIARRRTRLPALAAAVAVAAAACAAAAWAAYRALTAAVRAHRSCSRSTGTGSPPAAWRSPWAPWPCCWRVAGWPRAGAVRHGTGRAPGPGPPDGARRRWGRVAMATAVSVEAVVLLAVPTCPRPRRRPPTPGRSAGCRPTWASTASPRSGRSSPTTARTTGSPKST